MIRNKQLRKRRSRVISVELSNKAYETFDRYVGRHFNSPEEAVIHSMKTMVLLRHKALRVRGPPHSS